MFIVMFTVAYSEPVESSSVATCFLYTCIYIPIWAKIFHLISFLQIFVREPLCFLLFSHVFHMPKHSQNIWEGVQIIKLLIMHFSPLTCYFHS